MFKQRSVSFLIFRGILFEDMVFEAQPMFESKVKQPLSDYPPNDDYSIDLYDELDRLLLSITPVIVFLSGCEGGPDEMLLAPIQESIPFNPRARKLIFRRDKFIIYQLDIPTTRPSLSVSDPIVIQDQAKLRLRLDTGEQTIPWMNAVLRWPDGQELAVPHRVENGELVADLSRVARRDDAQLRVELSNGVQTTSTTTTTFVMPAMKSADSVITSISGRILAPLPSTKIDANQPTSFIGNIFDLNANTLPWFEDKLVWELDGKALPDSRQIAWCPALNPGKHTVRLILTEGIHRVLAAQDFNVKSQTTAQTRYKDVLQEFLMQSQAP